MLNHVTGRVDDIKIRLVPDGWAPAGRIAYIAFMSTKDCNDVLQWINGISFPKEVQGLRGTQKYWKEYDDFSHFPAQYLHVAKAQKNQWCPVSCELVDGKLPPGMKSNYKWNRKSLSGSHSSTLTCSHRGQRKLRGRLPVRVRFEQAMHLITRLTMRLLRLLRLRVRLVRR